MKIGICYNLVEKIERGTEIDKLSDNEIVGTVECVLNALEELGHTVTAVRIDNNGFSKIFKNDYDIIFNLCEGIEGNVRGESWFAGFLDLLGIPYTGSDSMALAMCLDKVKTKQILTANGIPTPKYEVFEKMETFRKLSFPFPAIVKPSREDGSVGVTRDSVVNDEAGLIERVKYITDKYNQPAIVEEYIEGRELNVAVLGNGDSAAVLPISEIVFDFLDGPNIVSYEAKWIEDSTYFKKTRGISPADLPKEAEASIKEIAIRAYKMMGCRDYARIDFRLRGKLPFLLEVNPNPSISSDSGFARSAKAAGYGYTKLIERILSEAVRRNRLR